MFKNTFSADDLYASMQTNLVKQAEEKQQLATTKQKDLYNKLAKVNLASDTLDNLGLASEAQFLTKYMEVLASNIHDNSFNPNNWDNLKLYGLQAKTAMDLFSKNRGSIFKKASLNQRADVINGLKELGLNDNAILKYVGVSNLNLKNAYENLFEQSLAQTKNKRAYVKVSSNEFYDNLNENLPSPADEVEFIDMSDKEQLENLNDTGTVFPDEAYSDDAILEKDLKLESVDINKLDYSDSEEDDEEFEDEE